MNICRLTISSQGPAKAPIALRICADAIGIHERNKRTLITNATSQQVTFSTDSVAKKPEEFSLCLEAGHLRVIKSFGIKRNAREIKLKIPNSKERRVGKEFFITCKFRWSPFN